MFKIRPLFFLLFALASLGCYAQTPGVIQQPITVTFEKDSVATALVKLQAVITADFAYDPSITTSGKLITRKFVNVPLGTVLDELLAGTGLYYKLVGGAVIIEKKKATTYTIDGHILDKETGEELIGANVYIKALHTGVTSNAYGFYSLTVPAGNYEVTISSLGFDDAVEVLHLDHSLSADFNLSPRAYDLNEVTISSGLKDTVYTAPAIKTLPMGLIKNLPYYDGEIDVVKAIQMQNGIKSITEGSSGLFVRGGNIDQNYITLDEAMIYNPSHLFGLVSVFNSDAIKNVQIYNDQIPANYGGRLSSVIDVRMADGNNKEFHVKGGANLLSMHIAAEGPLKKNAGSFLVTARRSVIDLLNHNFKIVNPNSSYYDLNLKANFSLSTANKIFYSFYLGNDHLFAKNSYSNNWGNITSTFRWNHEFNSRIFFNLSAIYSNYRNLLDVNADTISEKYQWKTGIRDFSFKGDFTFYKSPRSELKFGAISTFHYFTPGEATTAFAVNFNIPFDLSRENAVYFSHQLSLADHLQFTYGLRASAFNNAEERRDLFDAEGNQLKLKDHHTYAGLEPRAYLSYSLKPGQRVHAAYNHTRQYLQLIQNNELTFSSLETWMPAAAQTKPQIANYWSAGYDFFRKDQAVLFNFFYKRLDHQLELLSHTQIIKNPSVRDQLRAGTSTAYGAEVSVTKTAGNFSVDASYSYSRVFKKIKDINDGERFRANYDVPNEFKSTAGYSVSDRLSLSTFFTLSSGRAITLPVGYYRQEGIQVPIFEGRNRSRLPLFHRLDLSAKINLGMPQPGAGGFHHTLSAGIYNVYNKKNPLFYRIKQSADENLSLFESTAGIIPWVAYSFKF